MTIKSYNVDLGKYICCVSIYFNDSANTVKGGRTVAIYITDQKIDSSLVKPYEWGTVVNCASIVNIDGPNQIIKVIVNQTSGEDRSISGSVRLLRIS